MNYEIRQLSPKIRQVGLLLHRETPTPVLRQAQPAVVEDGRARPVVPRDTGGMGWVYYRNSAIRRYK